MLDNMFIATNVLNPNVKFLRSEKERIPDRSLVQLVHRAACTLTQSNSTHTNVLMLLCHDGVGRHGFNC